MPPIVLAWQLQAAHHQLHCFFFYLLSPTKHTRCTLQAGSSDNDGTDDIVTHSPSFDAIILLLKKSVFSRGMSCANVDTACVFQFYLMATLEQLCKLTIVQPLSQTSVTHTRKMCAYARPVRVCTLPSRSLLLLLAEREVCKRKTARLHMKSELRSTWTTTETFSLMPTVC